MPWCVHISTMNVLVLTDRCVRVPPEKGHADVSFWYATCVDLFLLQLCTMVVLTSFCESSYCVVGIILLLVRDISVIFLLTTIKPCFVSSPRCITTFGSSYYPKWVGMRLWKRSWISVVAPSPRSLSASIRIDHLKSGPYFSPPTVTEEWISEPLFIHPWVTVQRARL